MRGIPGSPTGRRQEHLPPHQNQSGGSLLWRESSRAGPLLLLLPPTSSRCRRCARYRATIQEEQKRALNLFRGRRAQNSLHRESRNLRESPLAPVLLFHELVCPSSYTSHCGGIADVLYMRENLSLHLPRDQESSHPK